MLHPLSAEFSLENLIARAVKPNNEVYTREIQAKRTYNMF